MHEVGIVTQTLEMAEDAARKAGSSRITLMRMRIGTYAGVVPDALEFAFEVVTKGTMAEGASLVIEEVPVLCRCSNGCPNFEPDGPVFACPACGSYASEMLTGKEMQLVDIEVED